MKTKLICGLIAFAVILGCGGAGTPYVPDGNNTTGGNFSVGGGGTQTINPGQSANFPLQVMLGQFADKPGRSPSPLTLSVAGLPANSTASFSANPVTPTDPATDVTMTVASQATTPVGTYTLTITGDDGTSRQTLTCTLNVNPVDADFNMVVEAQDGNMTNQPDFGSKARRHLIPDDTSAQYAVFVQPPSGYAGQVRVEYRFIEAGAPTGQDISTQFSSPAAATTTGSFTFNVVANVNPDAVDCLMTRLRQPIPAGTYTIEFKVVPLVAGYNGTTRNATLDIFDNSGVQNRGR